MNHFALTGMASVPLRRAFRKERFVKFISQPWMFHFIDRVRLLIWISI
ncbi:hypothetical protein THTE_1558 [Thermogutta terrifontis]|uniref:Uncharacterized protein n=1 Tax=Thermogutta terrifontis TaxID=1331910 RepID=A0A286RDX5_9BACT|nr:hypothetical protein THTE_1558 [Thermogutta terrifontis]